MFIPAKIGKIFLVNRFSLFYFPKTFQKSIAVFCSCSPHQGEKQKCLIKAEIALFVEKRLAQKFFVHAIFILCN